MTHTFTPQTVEELCQIVQNGELIFAENLNSFPPMKVSEEDAHKLVLLNRSQINQLIEIQPQNQTVTVGAGMKLSDLKQHLYAHQQVLPIRFNDYFSAPMLRNPNHIYELIDSNLPHTLSAQHGSWRDWILEAKIVLADGNCVKSGAKVVKSVSGYDLHKLVIGARASLGLVVEVTLRTIPFLALQTPEMETREGIEHQYPQFRYQRVSRKNWEKLCDWVRSQCDSYSLDHAASQAMYLVTPVSEQPTYPEETSWVWHDNFIEAIPSDVATLMKRAKQVFDPTNKLNPGVFGFL